MQDVHASFSGHERGIQFGIKHGFCVPIPKLPDPDFAHLWPFPTKTPVFAAP